MEDAKKMSNTNMWGSDNGFRDAVWEHPKRKRKLTGCYRYNPSSDTFTISLNKRDSITGCRTQFVVHNDTPEWAKWKLVRDNND